MIEINWKIFKAKFNGKEHASFERFCYLLFCKEYNRYKGIPRFKNQHGIETNPIEINDEKIGWQAKFYETRLSEHKKDFIQSIDQIKKTYLSINKVIFYTNQDFGSSKDGSDPKYKLEIESHARDKKLNIEWRTASYFESPFVCEKNELIAQHFFNLKDSVFDFIDGLFSHTTNLLFPIQSEIIYKKNRIKIDRTQILTELKDQLEKNQTVIITGEAGSGKTAIIKDWYEELKNDKETAFFVFKATEFNVFHINNLFKNYGNFTFLDFIKEYENNNKKYIIIDSAERLSDLENQEPVKEFLSSFLQNGWKVIFTTRDRYFDDLQFQLRNVHNIIPYPVKVSKFSSDELAIHSQKYNFTLPNNQKFSELLQTPLYLKEYLKNYCNIEINSRYQDFKTIIWKAKIQSSIQTNNIHIKREDYFLKMVEERANKNLFFVKIEDFSEEVSKALGDDEIIKYDSRSGGYFITHDIYEEWALEKIIERYFCKREDYKTFFKNIGDSLPIRRAFRDWLSEKLYIMDEGAKQLIQDSLQDNSIKKHWKDEILTAVLLSNYCSNFFNIFNSILLEKPEEITNDISQNNIQSHYEKDLLYKLLFLLRMTCKEADESIFDIVGLPKTNKNKELLGTDYMKPKGKGWNCTIAFLNKNKEHFKLQYINLIAPILEDWNNKNKKGETTKNASQLALFYYEKIMDKKYSFKYNDLKKRLLKIIFNGSFEIKEELKNIFQSIISKKETDHNSRYYQLVCAILLTPMESIEVIRNFPEQVIQLTDLFWTYKPEKKRLTLGRFPIPYDRLEFAECFSITNNYKFKYFPPNALNTPILSLLIFSYKQTVDFILSFTNKCIESFASSRFERELEEIKVFIDDKTSIKQYFSPRLWNMYRGNQAPNLLESIHMALERYFLNNCKGMDSRELEKRLLYLLKNSKSASISSVVASIVLAYPEKTFNIAKILFQTKNFLLCDNTHWAILDQRPITNLLNSSIENSLIKTVMKESNELEHRKKSLEHLALQYQVFASQGTTEKEVKNRQQSLWKIFDHYYKELSNQNNEQEEDRNWRLCLARMDRRKMNPKIEKIDGKNYIAFKPELPTELKKHSEDSLKTLNEKNKYLSLKIWAEYKFENKEEYKKKDYLKYENDPSLVIKETKDIIKQLENIPGDSYFPFFSKKILSFEEYQRRTFEQDQNDKTGFRVLNQSIPLYTCSVLIRDYSDKLGQKQKTFCKKIIMDSVSYLIKNNNHHQSISGKDIAIQGLSFLFVSFPKERPQIKEMLFSLLIKGEREFEIHSIKVIVNMWDKNFEDANSLFLGYLLLRQNFHTFMKKSQQANLNFNLNYSKSDILSSFLKEHNKELEEISSNRITYQAVSKACNFKDFYLDILIKAFEMLPLKVENQDHKEFIKNINSNLLRKAFYRK